MVTPTPLHRTQLDGLPLFKRGKVRDIYDLGDTLLIVSTDRISCFDVVLPTCIPHKGEVLTRLSQFWFDYTSPLVQNHCITTDWAEFPPSLQAYQDQLRGRTMVVRKLTPLPLECVVRGYLAGSGWREYQQSQSICGIQLPAGLQEAQRLPEPIFTPSTKADVGHDENVTQDYVVNLVGEELARRIQDISLALYESACTHAEACSIIIADTKFEFALTEGTLVLIDEVLTPDSSRFWPRKQYAPGTSQPSFDKQFVRDYLETLDWDKTPPGPELPPEVVDQTVEKYQQTVRLLVPTSDATGRTDN